MTQLRALIVDDEPLARRGLQVRLQRFDEIDASSQACNGKEALAMLMEQHFDLVFLDIQMPGMTGFELVDELTKRGLLPHIVFVTAYDQYAVQAFEIHAVDYLLKPVEENRLQQAIEKVKSYVQNQQEREQKSKLASFVAGMTGQKCEDILRRLSEGQALTDSSFSETIVIKDGGELVRVKAADILWIDAAGDYMCVHCQDGKTHIMRKTMKELESELDPRLFVRVHRSAIVNSQQIRKMISQASGEYHIVIEGGQELKVSRSYRDKVKAILAS